MSTATAVFGDAILEKLLDDARTFNAKVSVTGVLFCRDGSFFQYLEGLREGVRMAYGRVCASAGHHRIVELFNGDIDRREFPDWHMGFASASATAMLEMSQASWVAARRTLEESSVHKTDGILFLHSFLRAQRGVPLDSASPGAEVHQQANPAGADPAAFTTSQ